MTAVSGRDPADAGPTGWSQVLHPGAAPAAQASALESLCRRYVAPVYSYVRRCGHAPVIAHDIARSFLRALGPQVARAPGRHGFRDFLLEQLRAFLAGDWRDLADPGDAAEALSMPAVDSLEARFAADAGDSGSAEDAFQRSFACQVLAHALEELREEAERAGHGVMFQALLPYLASEPGEAVYAELAQRLGQRPLALIVALKRLRLRFRELADRELVQTVDSPADLAAEQRTLHGFLGSSSRHG